MTDRDQLQCGCADGWVARYYFEGLRQLTGNKPILISEWFFAAHENRTGNRNNGHLMTVQTQAERAQGPQQPNRLCAAADRGAPLVPILRPSPGGRPDGEDYNFGLVDIHDQPYEELTQRSARINPRLADPIRTTEPSLGGPPGSPWKFLRQTLILTMTLSREWPKARAFVPGLSAPAPDWSLARCTCLERAGLYLATIDGLLRS